ncbi:MAG: hypothetical protein ACREQ5_04710 [Candidatus Dormibacteria bacterium]
MVKHQAKLGAPAAVKLPRRRIVAIHEAGHAFILVHYDLAFQNAVVYTNGSGIVNVNARVHDEDMPGHVICTLAGPAAEQHFRHINSDFSDASNDYAEDFKTARQYCKDPAVPIDYSSAENTARLLVVEHWDSIMRIADALDKSGFLTAKQIRKYV